jgi:hypothetical protein
MPVLPTVRSGISYNTEVLKPYDETLLQCIWHIGCIWHTKWKLIFPVSTRILFCPHTLIRIRNIDIHRNPPMHIDIVLVYATTTKQWAFANSCEKRLKPQSREGKSLHAKYINFKYTYTDSQGF